ncbi:response regulator [Bacteroides heparinolyticus]|uniref:hybrid sensor histidine kinase/response regulator transcription factor n=2 Tax=Prevotella heparinolytica TaxID=28113 RepID=UPI00359FF4E7
MDRIFLFMQDLNLKYMEEYLANSLGKRFGSLFVLLFLCLLSLRAGANKTPYYHFKQLSINEGLPSSVTALYDDGRGSLWIGTKQGVYRFNGEKIKKYMADGCDMVDVANNLHHVLHIQGDKSGRIWFTTIGGVLCYEPEQRDLKPLFRDGKPVAANHVVPHGDQVIVPVADSLLIYDLNKAPLYAIPFSLRGVRPELLLPYDEEYFLMNDSSGRLMLLNKRNGNIIAAPMQGDVSAVNYLYRDKKEHYWIACYGRGVKCYAHDGTLLAEYNRSNGRLNNDIVLDIKEWGGALWMATDGGGVNVLYTDTGTVQHITAQNSPNFPANSATCLCPTDDYLWIGMVREGVLGARKSFIKTYTKASLNPRLGLSDKCPLCLWEESDGTLWIGTDGGGVNRFSPDTEEFAHYPATEGEKIVSLCPLSDTELLLSSFTRGLFALNKRTGAYRRIALPDKEIQRRLEASGSPVNLRPTSDGGIEIYGSAAYRYHPHKGLLTPIRTGLPRTAPSWIYIGTAGTEDYYHDRTRIFCHNRATDSFRYIVERAINRILTAALGSDGTLWFAEPGGVSRLLPGRQKPENIVLPDGNDLVTSLVAGRDGTVWMGAVGVLYAYDPQRRHFVIYSETDGVLPNDFLPKPVLNARDGSVYMGGSEGLLRVNPALKEDALPRIPRLFLQEALLEGAPVALPSDGMMEVENGFTSLNLSVSLSGADLFHKRIYRFRIGGLNEGYIETSRPKLTLQTLPPGTYRITGQCTADNGEWTGLFPLLTLTVLPPWWLRIPFLVAVGVLLLLAAVLAIRAREKRMQDELREKERMIYKDKVRALINISHELRTPLTLIYTPLKQLVAGRNIPYEVRMRLRGIFKQTRQMKNLIDMILNIRRMEVEENILRMSALPFNEWLGGVLDDFRTEFGERGITLRFEPDGRIGTVCFDRAQCEIVMNNLLTNAYKFSEAETETVVRTSCEDGGSYLRVTVTDHGIGLRDEDLPHLFTRFYRGDHGSEGTGIGLSYARQLVEMHGGVISAHANDDGTQGATFSFTLPLRTEAAHIKSSPRIELLNRLAPDMPLPKVENVQSVGREKYHSILIVEDDRDLCHLLVCELQALFEEVYEAHDGLEALPLLASKAPQIVVSDIRMPRMDGLKLCRYIKQRPELDYIPVILLTACADEEVMEEGYKAGAEAYITKPFDMEMLSLRIHTILHARHIVKEHYRPAADLPASPVAPRNHRDEELLLRLQHIICENIGNPAMDVSFLASRMGMSRATLYNKLKGVMDIGLGEYIVRCRMEHAIRLLQETDLGISEVAEQSGFRHARNFSTLFKSEKGMTPGQWRKNSG